MNQTCQLNMNIWIVGPKGTDPYVCQTGYDCNTGLRN